MVFRFIEIFKVFLILFNDCALCWFWLELLILENFISHTVS